MQERLAKLAGGVAVINVGAATEVEMKEKKLRIEDALAATRAAVEEGIVPGGGVALLSTIPELKKLIETLEGDEKTGAMIVMKAIEEPVRQIAKNAGFDGSVVVNNILSAKKANYGFDALKNEYTDMVKSGIIDPTKVSRSVLQNAASVAATLLTTESIVTDIPHSSRSRRSYESRYGRNVLSTNIHKTGVTSCHACFPVLFTKITLSFYDYLHIR